MVSVEIILPSEGDGYTAWPLGGSPADFNETENKGSGMYVWKVGKDDSAEVGEIYKIRAYSESRPVSIGGKVVTTEDISDSFAVINCKN